VGTISTSYKSHGAMLDPGYRTVAQMRDWGIQSILQSGAGEEGQGRATNTARYDSPDWNGLKVIAHYTLDSDNGADGEDDNPYGGGIQYTNGGILVFADYLTTDQGGDDDAWKVGGKFSMNNFAVFGQYESDGGLISTNSGYTSAFGASDGADTWFVGGSYTMGNNTIYGAYGAQDNASSATVNGVPGNPKVKTGYDAWEIVGIHSMSKQTLVYLGYVQNNPNQGGESDPEAWALGMKHKF
jgi:predicted porin